MLTQQDYLAVVVPTMPYRKLKIAEYIDQAHMIKLFKGESINHRAENRDDLYYFYVESGQLSCEFSKVNGEPVTVFFRNAGNAFSGELSGIASLAGNFKMRYIATVNSVVYGFSQNQLYQIAREDPDIYFEYMFNCHMAFGQMAHRIAETSVASSTQRLVGWLQKLCSTVDADKDGVYRIAVNITVQQVADLLGIHVTTASRIISHLEEQGLTSRTKTEIIVYDLPRLSTLEDTSY